MTNPVSIHSGKLESIFEQLEQTLDMIAPDLREWNKTYFRWQKHRYIYLLNLIQRISFDKEILEIGCTPCHLSFCLKKMNIASVGVDHKPERIQEFIAQEQLTVEKCDIENEPLPFSDNRFKLALFSEVFEHLRINPLFTLREINRVLSPGGTIILTTPNLISLNNRIKMLLGRSIDDPCEAYEQLDWLGSMGHVREYAPEQIRQFLNKCGFGEIDIFFDMFCGDPPLPDEFFHKIYHRFRPRFGKLFCAIHPPLKQYIIALAKKTR